VRAIFEQFDTDKSGEICEEEFVALVLAAFDDKNPLLQGMKVITDFAKKLGAGHLGEMELKRQADDLREFALECVPEIEKVSPHRFSSQLELLKDQSLWETAFY
jgi:hypothetical protein